MSQEQWTAVDSYFTDRLLPADPVLDAALKDAADAGLPNIQVAPNQGKLLAIIVQLMGTRTLLEIGTLGGYSTIWLARALQPGGKLISLEIDPKHADVARKNLERAGLANVAEVRLGSAHDSLPKLAAEGHSFDVVFIDADKPSTPEYLDWALKMTHKGSLIIIDNVVRQGGVADTASTDANVQGIQRAMDDIAHNPKLMATALQSVGSKGYDGLALALVVG